MSLCIGIVLAFFAFAQAANADPLVVRVQPSGDSFATAYVITGEARTYFGNVKGGDGSYQYKWEFSDGIGNTAYAGVGDAHYISIGGKVFATAGTQWARLTVQDGLGAVSSAQINLQVIAAASDTLNRQKNSAIDRGLRYSYTQQRGDGSFYGSGDPYGSTGMALVAMENHGHNLQSPDADIYKEPVQKAVQYLLDTAEQITMTNQECIGNPDSNGNGFGVRFGYDNGYTTGIAALGIANSCDLATAMTTIATTTNFLNGMSLFNIMVDANDYFAWAQGDQSSSSTTYFQFVPAPLPTEWNSGQYFYGYVNGLDVTGVLGMLYTSPSGVLACGGGNYTINWGDGSSDTVPVAYGYPGCNYYDYDYFDMGYYNNPPSPQNHTYASAGTQHITITLDNGVDGPIEVAYADVTTTGGGTTVCTDCLGAGMDVGYCNGGWRYSSNSGTSDNSVVQWPVLAMSEAKNRWGITPNAAMLDRLKGWYVFSQCTNGAFGYTYGDASGWCNYPKGGSGLIGLKFVGKNISDLPVQNAVNYLDSSFTSSCNTSGYDGNFGNFYGMYAMYKAMKTWGITTLPINGNWEAQYQQWLVANQSGSDTWSTCGWMDDIFATFMAVAMLAPEIAGLPPVANAGGPYPDVNPGQNVALDGTGSYHQDPAKNIVKWCWDFDAADGLWWDTKPAPGAGEGACGVTVNTSYADHGHDQTYVVTLQVTDNTSPTPMTDTDSATVKVTTNNVPPVAVTNGPWSGLPNTDIIFDGCASYDPNAGDSIVSYEWDLNGDGIFNGAADGTPVIPGNYCKVKKSFPTPVSLPATLRVTDTNGAQGTSSAQFNIVSIALVFGQQYETCFKVTESRFVERLGIKVKFKNLGNNAADNLVMTLTSAPSNLQILKSAANLGTLAAGQEKWSACDAAGKTADIELKFDRRIVPTGQWRWKADFDLLGQHYTVDNIPPLP